MFKIISMYLCSWRHYNKLLFLYYILNYFWLNDASSKVPKEENVRTELWSFSVKHFSNKNIIVFVFCTYTKIVIEFTIVHAYYCICPCITTYQLHVMNIEFVFLYLPNELQRVLPYLLLLLHNSGFQNNRNL